jgi:hypothetical protein
VPSPSGSPRGICSILLPAAATLLLAACGGDDLSQPAPSGTLIVATSTSGLEIDPDGYQIYLDDGVAGPIAATARVILEDLAPGPHRVRLEGVADNCRLNGEGSRATSLEAADSAEVRFTLVCAAATADVRVTTSTPGPFPDADGYSLSLDGGDDLAVGSTGSLNFPAIARGAHSLAVSGLADNCALAGPNPRSFDVSGTSNVEIALELRCAGMQVTISTTGSQADADGYTLSLDGGPPTSIPISAVRDVPLAPGEHMAQLDGLADNCATGNNPRHLTIPPGGQTATVFEVACLSRMAAPDGLLYWGGPATHVYRVSAGDDVDLGKGTHGTWSPDGSHIAFQRPRNGEAELVVVAADGSAPARLGSGSGPSWSPDAERIVFAHAGLAIMRVDGSEVRRLTSDASDEAPAWSPDGTRIVFQRRGQCRVVVFFGEICAIDLYAIAPDGSAERRLTTFQAGTAALDPAWSPDGLSLAYGRAELLGPHNIYLLDPTTGQDRRLTTGTDRFQSSPVWSPDGREIAFVDEDASGSGRLVTIPVSGGEMKVLTTEETPAHPSSWR